MKGWKLVAIIMMLSVVVVLFGFGVYSIINNNLGVANTTDFVSGDENVFVEIVGEFHGRENAGAGESNVYHYILNREMREAYSNENLQITSWNIGGTNFVARKSEVFTISFCFTNLNDVNGLSVKISNIAVDFLGRFTTEYRTAENLQNLQDANKSELKVASESVLKADMPEILLEKSETKYVDIIFSLKRYDMDIVGFLNNINVSFNSILDSESGK